jgi:hypothetical protein
LTRSGGFGFGCAAAGRGGLIRAGFAGRTIFLGFSAFVTTGLVVAGFVGRILTFGADIRWARAGTATALAGFTGFGFLVWRPGCAVAAFFGLVLDGDCERLVRTFVKRTLEAGELRSSVVSTLGRGRSATGACLAAGTAFATGSLGPAATP